MLLRQSVERFKNGNLSDLNVLSLPLRSHILVGDDGDTKGAVLGMVSTFGLLISGFVMFLSHFCSFVLTSKNKRGLTVEF